MDEKEAEAMREMLKKHDAKKKATQQKKQEVVKVVNVEDLQKILIPDQQNVTVISNCPQCNTKLEKGNRFCPECGNHIPESMVQSQPSKPFTKDERKQFAYQLWKDAKATSIVCIIAIAFPMIGALIGSINVMIGVLTGFIGMIFPCFILVKMMGIQQRCYQKYGWPTLFSKMQQQQFPQQQFPQHGPKRKQQNQDQELFF